MSRARITQKQFHDEFRKARKQFGYDKIRLLSEYKHSHTKLKLSCPAHGEFYQSRAALLKGVFCVACKADALAATKGIRRIETYRKKLFLISPSIKVSTKTQGGSGRLRHRCNDCKTIWEAHPTTMLKGKGCPSCNNWKPPKSKLDSAEWAKLAETRSAKLLEPLRLGVQLKHLCLLCGARFKVIPRRSDTTSPLCTSCQKQDISSKRMIVRGEWEDRIRQHHGDNIKLLGQYRGVGSNQRYRFKCYVCLGTWKAQLPSVGISGTGCPHCNNVSKGRHLRKIRGRFVTKTIEIAGVRVRSQGYEPQALAWLLEHKKLTLKDLVLDSSGKVPVIPYKSRKRNRRYYPDIFIPRQNRIIEVKSTYTLGLLTGKDWKRNQDKAKACLGLGYRFTLMLMDANGTRHWLPKNWHSMTRKDVLIACAFNSADVSPFKQHQRKRATSVPKQIKSDKA